MKRVLALAVACLLVAGAILIRDVVTDDDEGEVTTEGSGGGLVVACIPELIEACETLDAQVLEQDPAETIAALAAGEDIDAWVSVDPWPEMAGIIDDRISLGVPEPVAQTDLVLLVRTGEIPNGCGEPVTWTCLVDGLGDEVAVPGGSSAVAPLIAGHAAEDFLPGLASNDFADPEFERRIGDLDTGIDDPLGDIRVGLPEPAATGALAVDLPSLGGRRSTLTESPGRSGATVAVVVAGPAAQEVGGNNAFAQALASLRWEVTPDAATTGLPRAGVLVALQDLL